jgi:hypothetical protein
MSNEHYALDLGDLPEGTKLTLTNAPRYAIADMLQIKYTGEVWLVEDIQGYEYCFRILSKDDTRRDSIFYIDYHRGIEKIG